MPKPDDTNQVPALIDAPWLKRFFKRKFGITIRVRTMHRTRDGKKQIAFIDAWIRGDERFSPQLGNRCMNVVYAGHASLMAQNWGGNVGGGSISMGHGQWQRVLQGLIDNPITEQRERAA